MDSKLSCDTTCCAQAGLPQQQLKHTTLPLKLLQSSHRMKELRLAAALRDIIGIVIFFCSFKDGAGRSDAVKRSLAGSYVKE